MNRTEIEQFLSKISDIRILVVGDLMLDEYVWGRTERISPEAPVQVVDVIEDDLRLGGAGNVINNLLALGCRVEVVSALGDDADGERLRTLLAERAVATGGLVSVTGRTTSRKTRVLAGNQQMLRVDRESREFIDEETQKQLLSRIRSLAVGCQVILVSDYLKGVLTNELLAGIFAVGKELDIPVAVDPKGNDYCKYRGATLLTPNRKEAQTAAGIAIVDQASLCAAGRHLRETLDLEALVLTRSEEGISLFLSDGHEIHLPTEAREVFDVSGAGDTVLALLGVGLGGGLAIEKAAHIANLAAGIVVSKVGTSTVTPEEILRATGKLSEGDAKIQDRFFLKRILESERRCGRRIVFTNGCFDLLHVGHVRYLQKARDLGDLLILGLNSDDSIRRLKGPRRPLIGQEERAHLMAALKCIDYVVVFDEDTPLDLIEVLHPHILVKGGDYTPEGVVGKELVETYGGRVAIIPFVDGKSTTNIIEKILQQYREE